MFIIQNLAFVHVYINGQPPYADEASSDIVLHSNYPALFYYIYTP